MGSLRHYLAVLQRNVRVPYRRLSMFVTSCATSIVESAISPTVVRVFLHACLYDLLPTNIRWYFERRRGVSLH